MRAENPAALRYLLQDDIYLLQSDKATLQPASTTVKTSTEFSIKQPGAATTHVEQPKPAEQSPEPAAPIKTAETLYNYQGGNKKHFLVLTNYATEDFIAADHLIALQNILKRKDYELADIAILNIAKTTHNIIDLVNYFKPEKLLILGEAAVPAGMAVPPLNQPKKMKNGVLLRSFSFDEMMNSTDNKKAFWEQMKNL